MRLVIAICVALSVAACSFKSKEPDSVGPALAKELYNGEVVFIEHCSSCHQLSDLATRPVVSGDKNSLLAVHPFDSLKPEDIASVLTFVRNSLGNKADMVSIDDVKNFKNPPVQNK